MDGGWTAGGRRRPWVGGGRVSSAESRVDNDRDTVYHDKDYFREGRGRRRGKKGVGGWCCHLTGNRVTVIIPTAIIGRVLGRRAIFFCFERVGFDLFFRCVSLLFGYFFVCFCFPESQRQRGTTWRTKCNLRLDLIVVVSLMRCDSFLAIVCVCVCGCVRVCKGV